LTTRLAVDNNDRDRSELASGLHSIRQELREVVARKAETRKPKARSNGSPEGTRFFREAPRLFRRIAIGIVFVSLAYLVAVGFATVPPQVLAPERSTEPVGDCSDAIRALRSELLARSSAVTAGAGASDGHVFWREWDRRFAAADHECTSEPHANALVALGRLRYRIEADLDRFEETDLPLVREIDRHLAGAE
jgi:hypothetical protein